MRLFLTSVLLLLPVCAQAAKNIIYNNPKYYSNGLPIDSCLYPAKQCGHAAADKFCKDMNAGSVINFKTGRSVPSTYIQGSGETCDLKKWNQCIPLIYIECGTFTY